VLVASSLDTAKLMKDNFEDSSYLNWDKRIKAETCE
jgi:hypothetical protein